MSRPAPPESESALGDAPGGGGEGKEQRARGQTELGVVEQWEQIWEAAAAGTDGWKSRPDLTAKKWLELNAQRRRK